MMNMLTFWKVRHMIMMTMMRTTMMIRITMPLLGRLRVIMIIRMLRLLVKLLSSKLLKFAN